MSSTQHEGRTPLYDSVFKLSIAREYLTSSLGYGALARKYGLKISTVRFFVRWYRVKEVLLTEAKGSATPPPSEPKADEAAEVNLKVTALELLIQTASKELGVDLVKKFGTKPSAK